MKISAYENVGAYSKSIDIEYDSSVETDRKETDKYISRVLPSPWLEPPEGDTEELRPDA